MYAVMAEDNLKWATGHAALYELSAPAKYLDLDSDEERETSWVVVSTASMFGVETFIFPSDQFGDPLNYLELAGSQKGCACHDTVLRAAGYEVVPKFPA